MIMVVLLAVSVVVALAASAFFSGAETSFLSVSRGRVLHLSREGSRKARIVQAALADMGRTTTTILIGNNLANVAYSTSSAALALALCSGSTARTVWSFVAAFTVLYVSEFMPKLLCAARPLRRALLLADAYRWAAFVLAPLTHVAMALTNLFIPGREARDKLTEADLVRILQDRKDGVCLSDIESALIGQILARRVKGRTVTAESLLEALRETE